MDEEQTILSNGTKPFYDGQGYLRIPVDEYYDEDGNLHKAGYPKEPDKDSRDPPDPEVELKPKTVTKVKIKVILKS